MAGKITEMTELSVPALEDWLEVVDDPSGTPLTRRSSWTRVGGLLSPNVPQIRLTTETGVPASKADRTAQGTLYATPSTPGGVSLATAVLKTWDGTRRRVQSFSGDKSLSLAIASGAVQDIFIKDSDLSLVAEYWKNSTVTMTIASPAVVSWNAHGLSDGDAIVFATSGALPTGFSAGVTYYLVNKTANDFQLALAPGGTVKNSSGSQSGTHTAYVVSVGRGNTTQPRTNALATPAGTDLIVSGADNTDLYLGTIRASGSNVTEDSQGLSGSTGKRYVWNAYNRLLRPIHKKNSSSHTYNGSGGRPWNNQTTESRAEAITGWPGEVVHHFTGDVTPGSGGFPLIYSIMDWSLLSGTAGDTALGDCVFAYDASSAPPRIVFVLSNRHWWPLGYHYIIAAEYDAFSVTSTFTTVEIQLDWWG